MKNKVLHFTLLMLLSACGGAGITESTPPQFTDIDLVGYWHRDAQVWDAGRFAPHVSWKAPDGSEQWLFNAFLFLEGYDKVHDKTLTIAPEGVSAGKAEWEYQLEIWLGSDGSVSQLDKACADAASRIGDPEHKRQVVIGIPDAIMFQEFADKKSPTDYWGDGLDFADVQNRIKAYRWYVDEARRMFKSLDCKYLELAGFYITSEELYLPCDVDVNCRYKNWETIIPAVAQYCHDAGQGLYWIPYHMAPGYKYWKDLGFDQAWMQPNWYWDLGNEGAHPFCSTISAIREADMSGMELEFEYSCVTNEMKDGRMGPDGAGRLVFDASDVPALKDRVRRYMSEFRKAGFLGKRSIALYSGSNALTQLATSPEPEDKALYDAICRFVLQNRCRDYTFIPRATIVKDDICIGVDYNDASLTLLSNGPDGHNFAGGEGLWRMYYNTPDRKEIELTPADGTPTVSMCSDTIRVDYSGIGGKAFGLSLRIWAENGQARFAASVSNNEPHTIIRELQYPLIGNLQLPEGYKLLTTHTGGQIFDNPVQKIANVDTRALYMTPAQKFRQYDLQYPRNAASNCFAFVGTQDGLYFGSHDISLQQTWHGLRAYPKGTLDDRLRRPEADAGGVGGNAPRPLGVQGDNQIIGHMTDDFTRLEAGFYRYPNAMCGDSWSNDCSVVAPYTGDWTATCRIYREWADSWWRHESVPDWVQDMTGWQRIIFKHQYGEYLRRYTDLPGHIADVGESVGCNAVLAFGWWKEGMDNGYPNYTVDDTQGGDAAWKEAIRQYRDKGNRLLLYFNGRLIDVESNFYRNGGGKRVANKDNTGREFTEHYKFTGEGTTLGYYDSRTFVIADMSKREWRDQLINWADRAMEYGADAVFYDQLGVAEEFPNWNLSREYPVQDIFTGRYKAEALKEIHDHIKARNPEFALGTEWLSDCTSQFCDFVHIVEFTALPESFPEWFRYTFPEVKWSDRCVRDDNDVPRRVNNTLLKGLMNDIEVFRCRGLIDETPVYQEHLAKVNAIRHEFPELLLRGRFIGTDGFECSNDKIAARGFTDGKRLAIVATSTETTQQRGRISVPGWKLSDCRTIGHARYSTGSLTLETNGLIVLIYDKEATD